MSLSEFGRVQATVSTSVAFSDADGVLWHVTERDARQVPGCRGDRCLIFMSDCAVRRVWDFPSGWRDLPAAELLVVSWRS